MKFTTNSEQLQYNKTKKVSHIIKWVVTNTLLTFFALYLMQSPKYQTQFYKAVCYTLGVLVVTRNGFCAWYRFTFFLKHELRIYNNQEDIQKNQQIKVE